MLRKSGDENIGQEVKLKAYNYILIRKELYVYKNNSSKHHGMHSLVGVFLKDANEEMFDCLTQLHSFKLIFLPNTVR